MQNLNVTLVQANQIWENKSANYANYERLLSGVKTDLIVLPEMFNTGFSMNTNDLAEPFEESEGINRLKKIAAEKNAAIYTSLIIQDREKMYNRGVFIHPSGQVNTYDKRKTFGLAGENNFFNSGKEETIVFYKGWRIQLQICYDLRFPEIVRNRIEPNLISAYDVILYVANWPQTRSVHWNTLLKARAIENQCYVVGVNRVGEDGKNNTYVGDSKVVDALGNETNLEPIETVQTCTLDVEELIKIRKLLPFLKDRETH